MNPSRLMTQAATITPRAPADDPDEYNDEVLEDGTPFQLPGGPGRGVQLQPLDASEDTVANTERETRRLFAPLAILVHGRLVDVLLDARSKITVAGADWELASEPQKHWHPREERDSYQDARVVRVT